jgi:hypothetical protein
MMNYHTILIRGYAIARFLLSFGPDDPTARARASVKRA